MHPVCYVCSLIAVSTLALTNAALPLIDLMTLCLLQVCEQHEISQFVWTFDIFSKECLGILATLITQKVSLNEL